MQEVLERLASLEENVAVIKVSFILFCFGELMYLVFYLFEFIRVKIKKDKEKENK